MNVPFSRKVSRRDALRWMAGAAATISILEMEAPGLTGIPGGFGTDPNLHQKNVLWPRILTEAELVTVTALCDVIIPADEHSPSASAVGVPDFIDEWVSAPYPQQIIDRKQIRDGLVWIDQRARTLFGKTFAALEEKEKIALCGEISQPENSEDKTAAAFFAKMRNLTAGGFYTTPEGWKDIGYLGNTPMVEFPGPPPEVLKHLGLA